MPRKSRAKTQPEPSAGPAEAQVDRRYERLSEQLKAAGVVPAEEIPDPKLPSFAAKIASQKPARPVGPKKLEPGEMRTVYVGPNVELKMDAENISLEVIRPVVNETRDGVEMFLSSKQQERLTAAGFEDVSFGFGASSWLAHRNPRSLAVMQQLASEIDGKGERMARGR